MAKQTKKGPKSATIVKLLSRGSGATILAAITEGTHPPTLTGRRLLRASDVPLDWSEQRRLFGFN